MQIRFGTSGWRAVIADEFTFENVRGVTEAICRYLITEKGSAGTLIVGHDTRFMGEKFAAVAAELAARKGFRVLQCDGPVPTPTVSHAIRSRGADGALNFTASHNPPEYQGIKFSTSDGAPALPEITSSIERYAAEPGPIADTAGGTVEEFDACPEYLADLSSKVRLDEIANAGGRYVYDPLWGTGRGYLDRVLREHGIEVDTLHDWRDVTFGGRSPEPGETQLIELREFVIENGCKLGVATDGDGDRFGVIDASGEFITANQLIAILTDHLAESRRWKLGVARSVATSHLVDRVAKDKGLKIFETPVGFKFIGELIINDELILGGEESAGLSIRGHYPEKDGLLACLLAIEAVTVRNASLTEQLEEIYRRVGRIESGRIGVKLSPEVASSLTEKLAREPDRLGGRKVAEVNRLDGVKFIFTDGSWLLMRASGTEPLVRIYAESESKEDLEKLLEEGREYISG
jgi:phosphoglucomutase